MAFPKKHHGNNRRVISDPQGFTAEFVKNCNRLVTTESPVPNFKTGLFKRTGIVSIDFGRNSDDMGFVRVKRSLTDHPLDVTVDITGFNRGVPATTCAVGLANSGEKPATLVEGLLLPVCSGTISFEDNPDLPLHALVATNTVVRKILDQKNR